MKQFFKSNLLPIVLAILGVLDQTTDLFILLLSQIGAPNWVATLFRIFVIVFGAFKLHYTISPKLRNNTASKDELPEDIGGGGIKNPKT